MYAKLFVQLLRPKVASMLVLFVCLGMASSEHVVVLSLRLLALVGALAAWYVNATSVNDLADQKIDAINLKSAKGRPLVDHSASRVNVTQMAVGSAGVALGLSALVSTSYMLVMLAGILLSLAYSLPPIRISYRGIWAPLLLPIGYVVIPFMGGTAVVGGALDRALLIACYVGFVGRIILKDFRDIKGDTKYGKRTFVVRHGKQATCLVSLLAWTVGNVLFWYVLPGLVWVLLQPVWVLIVHGLYLLSRTDVFRDEQVIIGLMARLANGLLIATLGYLLAGSSLQLVVVGSVSVLFFATHIYALAEFEHIQISYK